VAMPVAFYAIELAAPGVSIQQAAWERALQRRAADREPSWPEQLVSRFSLTPGQIDDAARWAERRRVMRQDALGPDLADLYAACRQQSSHQLGELAVKIEPRNGWHDLIVPEDTRAQLREISVTIGIVTASWANGGSSASCRTGRG
jgi:hypothetical protein